MKLSKELAELYYVNEILSTVKNINNTISELIFESISDEDNKFTPRYAPSSEEIQECKRVIRDNGENLCESFGRLNESSVRKIMKSIAELIYGDEYVNSIYFSNSCESVLSWLDRYYH